MEDLTFTPIKTMRSRIELLEALIEFRVSPQILLEKLAKFGWDAETPLVRLEVRHIINILKAYIATRVSSSQVEEWANAIEVREDIEFGEASKDLIFVLANPELNDPSLSVEWAQDVINTYG
jgi:hypothetical protein